MKLVDARGRELEIAAPPRRIVSLVPSLTETLFALGCGERVAGATDYCVHPAEALADVPRVGGTKNPDVERICALAPDLVLANKEENRRRKVEQLEARGVPVWVGYARSVAGALEEIELLGRLGGREDAAAEIVASVQRARLLAYARVRRTRPKVVALVWKSPWMVVGGDTFAGALLAECGGANPFADAEGRYPRIDLEDLERAAPDVILLPTEPYAFGEAERRELLELDCPASLAGRVHVVEGELLSWYGPRMARALDLFSSLLSPVR